MTLCLTCPTPISRTVLARAKAGRKVSGLCQSCYRASIKKERRCCECGAELVSYVALRCQTCNNRLMAKDKARETRRIERALAVFWRPEVRARHSLAIARSRAVKLAWCPADYLDQYRRLAKHMSAADAKAKIMADLRENDPFALMLARVAAGASIASVQALPASVHSFTLGGVVGYGG